jgi:2,4-dienoyl-CoA reductase-like NADH-dependent reductase (Old Yellow Enzyme family)
MISSSMLFKPFKLRDLTLKNRITMAPLYLGYANPDGTVSPLLLDHYREMAASGAALIVVENAAADATGLGSPFTLRVDHDRYLPGLSDLAGVIHQEGAHAFLQINHAGRYAFGPDRIAPSAFKTGQVVPREMTEEDIGRIVEAFAEGAGRVKEAGFDGVEIHGGTGYLLVQFLSPRTNLRKDGYGGTLRNRMRFPLLVTERIMAKVGKNFPVGYRFLADEELPEGLHPVETVVFAKELENRGISYLSVMAGTYDSFFLPEYLQKEKKEAYMAHYAGTVKKAVPKTPIITAGRIQTPFTANEILEKGTADLIGLARVLLADPLWPKKAEGVVAEPIVNCEPTCSLCMKRAVKGKPVLCARWSKERRDDFLERIGETHDEMETVV